MLDMSMPTYGDIKSSSASVSNVKSLSVDLKDQPLGVISRKKTMTPQEEAPKAVTTTTTTTTKVRTQQPFKAIESGSTSLPGYDF